MSSNADADSLFEDELKGSSIEKIGNTEEQDIKTGSQIFIQTSGSENLELALKKIEIEQKYLKLQEEKFLFEKERMKAELEIKRIQHSLEIEFQKDRIQLEHLQKKQLDNRQQLLELSQYERQLNNRNTWFKMFVSLILIASGMWLIYREDNLGPFLLGTGAGGAGIQSVSELVRKDKRKTLEESTSDAK